MRQAIDRPIGEASVEADVEGATAANTRRITIQVRDRRGKPWARRWLVWVYVAAAAGGDPQNAQTTAWVSGYVLMTAMVHGAWFVVTDADGRASIDVTIAGAATRYIAVEVGSGLVRESDPLTWS